MPLSLNYDKNPVMTIQKEISYNDRLVYFIVTDKENKFRYGRRTTRIAYIGTSKNALHRIPDSVKWRTKEIFDYHQGVTTLEVRVATCSPRQGVKTWKILERAFLLEFRNIYGEVPISNIQGRGFEERKEFTHYFDREEIRNVILTMR